MKQGLSLVTFAAFAAASPVEAQQLYFSQGMSSQKPSLGVYDARSNYVGQIIDRNLIGININGNVVSIDFTPKGFSTTGPYIYFELLNCGGNQHLNANALPVPATFIPDTTQPYTGYTTSGKIYFAKPPFAQINVNSYQYQGFPANGPCNNYGTTQSFYLGAVQTYTVSSRITPPFTVK